MRWIRRIHRLQHRLQVVRKQLSKSVRQRMINLSRESRPVFLVGCGRSGTSMLVTQLSSSLQIDLYNEGHPAAFKRYRLRELAVIERLVERSKAPIVLFKPILDTHQTPRLLAHFPDARVIFPFRHYDDVVNSSLKKFGVENRITHLRSWMADDFEEFAVAPPPEHTKALIRSLWQPSLNPESAAALYWLFYNQLYYDLDLAGDDRVLLLNYESMVLEPRRHFEALTRFLDLEFEEPMVQGILSSSIKRDDPPAIEPQIRDACEALHQRLNVSLSNCVA